ncbi:HAL/PAL/TAL family ammonia-lyase [Prosthecomicrobium hirschii]|uniref:HAL/PAL/TAL family ammonia-lyase n=1 Tax=Prosthecodimorpha hirschii TaxID=665126 RepID=UPI00221FF74F|nr:aromatic amino acid ammonia-lyase [Prosthecomicrobium hirschii]MCW1840052.1 aromatic amino acid lyase [Prosthecomicrobium hirschii]
MTGIGDAPLTLADVERLVAGSAPLAISDAARTRIEAARQVVDTYAAGTVPVYGLNTGLGGNIGFRIDRDAIPDFQAQLVVGRNVGLGNFLPEPICRAGLLARIAGATKGGAGLSLGVIEQMTALFNAGVSPAIPEIGSIGAGDLGIAAHLGAALIGRGEAYYQGERLPAAVALERAGLTPIALEPKDGIALCNASTPMVGFGVVTLAELGRLLATAIAVSALAFEAYGANPRIFDARIHAARPAAGQTHAAALYRALLDGSPLVAAPRTVQDALSYRCLAPIVGSALDAYAHAVRELEIELNGEVDSPLVLIEAGEMLSSPNFHTPSIALAVDAITIALSHLAAAGAMRVVKLMNPTLSGLPKYLSPVGGPSAGFVPMQKTTAALEAEIRLGAAPASLGAMPVSDTVEDVAPMTLLAFRKLARQMEAFRLLVAVEATVAAQAADLRTDYGLSPAAAALHGVIRSVVPRLEQDRETGPDVMAVCRRLAEPSIAAAIAERVGRLMPSGA